MQRQLLICAAIDLSGAIWPERDWQRMVASLKLGKAGNIRQCSLTGAALVEREDVLPGTEAPQVSPLRIEADAGGAYTLLAGKIWEHEELAARLGIAPENSDARLYAAAYRRWGDRCDAELIGEYAAIQWFPQQARVRLARSPIAAPPLHVWREGDRLIAASLPRSIFASGVEARLDPHRIADVALFNFGDGSRSFYKGLSRVSCGSWQIHDPAGERRIQYWSLGDIPAQRLASDREYVEALDEQLSRAVRANLAGLENPALQLSGGLDSQAVAATTISQLPPGRRIKSYTAVPVTGWTPNPNPRLIYDESARVRGLAKQYPTLDPAFLTGEASQFGADLDAMTLLSGWPSFNEMNMHWLHALHRQAAKDSSYVLLDGDFGDMAFSYDGLTGYPAWLRQGRWVRLLRELRASSDLRPLWRKFLSLAVMPHLPDAWRLSIDNLRGFASLPLASWCPLDPNSDVVRGALARAEADGHDPHMYPPAVAGQARERMLSAAQSEGGELALGLRLLHGVETRSPLAFRPLVEFCAGIPDGQFLRNGVSRSLARKLLEGRVPDEVAHGTQTAIQSADFLGRVERDREAMLDSIARVGDSSTAAGLIDLPRLKAYLEEHRGLEVKGSDHWLRMTCAVPRGIALARFAQFVEGSNDG